MDSVPGQAASRSMTAPANWRPRVIFFDLDDTLIYEVALDKAIMVEVVGRLVPRLTVPTATLSHSVRTAARALWERSGEIDYCRRINTSAVEGLYGDYAGDDPHLGALRAFIQTSRYRERVWTEALRSLGIDDPILGLALAGAYAEERWSRHVRFPDALPAVERLARAFRLGLITNGAPAIQRAKFQGSGLARFFDPGLVVVSGDLGVGKPDPTIFTHALNLAGVPSAAALMVGNSLLNDIAGAQNVGIRAVWVDRNGEPLPPTIRPYQIVTTLAELFPDSDAMPA